MLQRVAPRWLKFESLLVLGLITMWRRILCWLFLCVPLFAGAQDFDLSKLADGVYAAIRREPPGLTFVGNSVFIINDDDVVVVDTGVGPATAQALIKALRGLTAKPVRYVVNTHWHDDHMMGNQAWREAYPGIEFIGQANTAREMLSTGASNRRQLLEGGPAFAQQIRDALAKNLNLAGKPITLEERASYASDVLWAERYFAEAPAFKPITPGMTVDTEMTLVRGARRIDIRYLGRAHTGADLIVHLPAENILVSGDLIVWPVPLFGSTSFPSDYIATLEKLLALKPGIIVPGHGPVMKDDAYARQMLALLQSIDSQVRAAVARGETLDETRKSIKLETFRQTFAGDSALKALLFNSYVTGPGVARAWQQISGKL